MPQPVHDQRGGEIADDETAAGLRHRRPGLGCPKLRLNRTDAPSQYPSRRGEWKVTNEPTQGGRNPPGSAGRAEALPLIASGHRKSHAVDVCLSECPASPGTREVDRWRVIGKSETGSSGCRAGLIHLPGRARNRSGSSASLSTGTARSIQVCSGSSGTPSRPASTGRYAAAWVFTHLKKVTQSSRADPIAAGTRAPRSASRELSWCQAAARAVRERRRRPGFSRAGGW